MWNSTFLHHLTTAGRWDSLPNTIGTHGTAYRLALVFNMFEIRPEFRKWFRMKPKEGNAKPTRERAFFLGGYASGGTYSIKPGKYGIQGPLFGAGALFGYDFPLYTYRHFAIDFELGVAAGLAVTSYDGYTMNRSNTDYIEAPGKSRDGICARSLYSRNSRHASYSGHCPSRINTRKSTRRN